MERKNLSILVVCAGNICRSPMAEAVLRQKAQQRDLCWKVDSAGVFKFIQGKAPDPKAILVANNRGYNPLVSKSRRIINDDFETFDLILAVDKSTLADLFDICPFEYRYKLSLFLSHSLINETEIPDPYQGGISLFEQAFDLIDVGSEGIFNKFTA